MLREFEIFTKPSAASIAVKRGFSWPGYFFIWIWAFSAGLFLEGGMLLLGDALICFLKYTFLINHQVLVWLFALVLQIYVGMKGNFWRSRKLERAGYSFEGLITANSPTMALSAFARDGKSQRVSKFGSKSFFAAPKFCQRIFAIAGLTWKAALRFKLFLVITALLLIAVIGLPLVIKDDGTAEGFTQIILTYTLSAITALLGLSTIWLSCGTLARDIEECQIQVVVTKPIARWQIWIGKWLGIVTLNAVLLLISGAFVFGLLEYRASKLPADVQQKLRTDILVARGVAKEADMTAAINEETAREFTARMAQASVEKVDEAEVKKIIRAQVKASAEQVPPGYFSRPWQIDLGFAKNFLADKPLQLRIKFNGAERSLSGTFTVLLQAGDPKSGKFWRSEALNLAPSTEEDQVFHEIPIPANLFDSSGVLTIIAYNPNSSALSFPLEDGMEVLYPDGGFAPNFARGLGIIFCWLALMAALGLMAASFLSFPVAAFFSLTMLVVVFSSGTLADAIDSGSVAAGNEETGQSGHSVMDVVLIPAFKGLLSVIRLVQNFSPVDALSTGRCITWTELGLAFTQIVLVIGGIFAVMGIYFFSRRELATAQTQ